MLNDQMTTHSMPSKRRVPVTASRALNEDPAFGVLQFVTEFAAPFSDAHMHLVVDGPVKSANGSQNRWEGNRSGKERRS
jgi:hypothetical protein